MVIDNGDGFVFMLIYSVFCGESWIINSGY